MKPSISSGFVKDLNAYEMVDFYLETGFKNTEIGVEHSKSLMNKEIDAKEFRKYIDNAGFSIPQGHLIFMNEGNITSVDNEYAIDNLKRNLDVYHEIGVKAAVLHYSNFGTDVVPIEDWFDVRVDALNKLTDHIKGTDMVICLENLSRIHDLDAGHLLKMCKAVKNPEHIGICLDTGHLNISQRGNQYDFIMQAGKWLKAMHVHDNRGEQYGLKGLPCDWHIMPFDTGNVNWEDVKRGVKELNYQHLFSFELGDAGNPIEIRKIKAKYLMEVYKAYFEF